MDTFSRRQQALLLLLLFVVLLVLLPPTGHPGDLGYWKRWASYGFEHGLSNVYEQADNNYNPLYHYVLWGYGQFMGSPAKIAANIHWLKAFTLLFDFAGALWAASLVRERHFSLAWLLVLNIAYLYNTLVWGQVDAIYTFFAFGAVVLATRQQTVGSVGCFVLALAAKTQAIIFLPPLLLLWGLAWWRRPGRLLLAAGAGTALAALVLAPFTWGSEANYLAHIIKINLGAAETYPIVSMGAYNLWHLLPGKVGAPDLRPLAGLTYRTWGLLLFCGASALALLPLLLTTLRGLRSGSRRAVPQFPTPSAAPDLVSAPDLTLVLLSCGLIPLLFAFFNTQMHERYWHAAVLFLAAYGFLRRDYLPYALVSVAYFLNMENLLRFVGALPHHAFFFKSWFAAVLFALTIVVSLVRLYQLAAWRADWHYLRRRGLPAAVPPPPATLVAVDGRRASHPNQ